MMDEEADDDEDDDDEDADEDEDDADDDADDANDDDGNDDDDDVADDDDDVGQCHASHAISSTLRRAAPQCRCPVLQSPNPGQDPPLRGR